METVVRPFEPEDAPAVARLCADIGWSSVGHPDVVRRVCEAPGSTAFVAAGPSGPVGWAQALGDGVITTHLSFLVVAAAHRRRGIGRLLLVATFQASGGTRVELVSDAAAAGFYASFDHEPMPGFRVFPGR